APVVGLLRLAITPTRRVVRYAHNAPPSPQGGGTKNEVCHPLITLLTILFDGAAYGMLLFVIACGLAVTLGLMNFVNLAHGAFAMVGGYICAGLVNRYGWPFAAGLPMAFLTSAAVGLVLERL